MPKITQREVPNDSSPLSFNVAHHRHATSPTRTYTGRSRSFLIALPTPKMRSPPTPEIDVDRIDDGREDFETRESYADLRTRWGVDMSESDPRDPSPWSSPNSSPNGKSKAPHAIPIGMMNDLKSISELRTKGESRRFHDEVGYLFEGMDPTSGIGLRRTSALEIVTKLCHADFLRRAKASDFLSRAWDVLREAGAGHGDKVLDVTLAFFAALAARDPRFLSELAHKSDFVSTLFSMLFSTRLENDILAGVSAGKLCKKLSKTENAHLKTLSNTILKSGIFSEAVAISTRLLISQALISLPPASLSSQYVSALRHNLISELSLVPSCLNAYMSGLPLLPLPSPSCLETPSLEHIENCLRLLDSFLLGRWSLVNDDVIRKRDVVDHAQELANGLVSLCLVAESLTTTDQSRARRKIAYKCIEVTLRVLVSLTQESQDWNQRLIQQEFLLPFIMRAVVSSHRMRFAPATKVGHNTTLPTEDNPEFQALHCFCLALGLLTNLVQGTADAKEKCRETQIDPACPAQRDCICSCRCDHRISALNCLAFIYLQQETAGDQNDPTTDFLRGHLAVLFGLLMRQNPANQSELLKALPGGSDCLKLDTLIRHVEEFVAIYAEFTSRLATTAAKPSKNNGDNNNVETSIRWNERNVDSMIRDGKGESVARDVVSLLRKLRDKAEPIT